MPWKVSCVVDQRKGFVDDYNLSFIKTSYTRNINELAIMPFGDVG